MTITKTEYNTIHKWNLRHWSKSGACEICSLVTRTQWSNVSGLYIPKDSSDWQELCRDCHQLYDKHVLGRVTGRPRKPLKHKSSGTKGSDKYKKLHPLWEKGSGAPRKFADLAHLDDESYRIAAYKRRNPGKAPKQPCSLQACEVISHCKGYCAKHYASYRYKQRKLTKAYWQLGNIPVILER